MLWIIVQYDTWNNAYDSLVNYCKYNVIYSSNPILCEFWLLFVEIIFVESISDVERHLLSLLGLSHVHIILSYSHCLKSLQVLCFSCFAAVLNILLLNSSFLCPFLISQLLLFNVLILHQLLSLSLVGLLKLKFLLSSAKDSHLAMLSDLIKFSLLMLLLSIKSTLLLRLECEVFVPNLLWLAIHDISFTRLHFWLKKI